MAQDLTPTQRRIYNLLSDGKPHERREIFSMLEDDLAQLNAINNHLSQIRKKLEEPYTILCILQKRKIHYQLVALPPKHAISQIFPPIPMRFS